METKQTALQWLLEQWPILESQIPPSIINKALRMERKQIENAHIWGQEDEKEFWNIGDKVGTRFTIKSEEYYNKIYGGKDE
jgi:hypothetical protein